MRMFLVALAGAALVMIVLDFLWLGSAGNAIYRPRLGRLLLDRPVWPPAILFYVGYVMGLTVLATLPGLQAGPWFAATWRGALLGALAYGTYDLTNWATLRGWDPLVACLDLAWGTLLSASAATAGWLAARWLG